VAKTLTTLLGLVTHALRGDAPASPLVAADLVNEAGERLVAAHPWNWLLRPPASLSLTAGQNYVALPADFASLYSIDIAQDVGWSIRMTEPAEVASLRARQSYPGFGFVAAVAHPGQTVVTAAPGPPRLELWPTPTQNYVNALTIVYRPGWAVLAAGTDVANVPVWVEPLLSEMVVAVAQGYEDETPESRVMRVLAGPTFASTVARDGRLLRAGLAMGGGHTGRRAYPAYVPLVAGP